MPTHTHINTHKRPAPAQALLNPIIELVALQLFGSCLAVAVDAFSSRLDAHKWVAMPTPMFKQQQQQQQQWGVGGDGGADGGGGEDGANNGGSGGGAAAGGGGRGDDLSPPYALMEHLPLAVFTNGVLSAFNELRHCALAPLRRPAAALLQGALERAAAAFAHYRATRALGDAELALFKAAARAHGEVVVPYLSACFARLFGGGGGGGAGAVDAAAVGALLQEALDDSSHVPARY
jgi:hypothetical protein